MSMRKCNLATTYSRRIEKFKKCLLQFFYFWGKNPVWWSEFVAKWIKVV